MKRILVSACLMGEPVRYDGKAKPLEHRLIKQWRDEGRLVVFCPELAAGFHVPRPAAEIAAGASGKAVLAGEAAVMEAGGEDVSAKFIIAAKKALAVAKAQGCEFALLIDGSPSCGSGFVYDGSFSGVQHPGQGVTTALLSQSGIQVFSPSAIEDLAARIAETEAGSIS